MVRGTMSEKDFFLEKTKIKLQKLDRVGTTAQNLISKFVTQSIQFYLSEEHQHLRNLNCSVASSILNNLVKPKCKHENGNAVSFGKMIVAFRMLLRADTRVVQMGGLKSFCPEHLRAHFYQEVVNIIAECAPKINKLIFNEESIFETVDVVDTIDQTVMDGLLEMQHLTELHLLSLQINISDLMYLCRAKPRLRFVRADKLDISLNKDQLKLGVLASFANLKSFLFRNPNLQKCLLLDYLCRRYLANIEIVLERVDEYQAGENLLKHCAPESVSQLKHVYLPIFDLSQSKQYDFEFELRMFPKATHLLINAKNLSNKGYRENKIIYDRLRRFPNIECLHFVNLASKDLLTDFLNAYGPKLDSLLVKVLTNKTQTLTFEWIFEKCPLLNKLSLDFVDIEQDRNPSSFAQHLKVLEWFNSHDHLVKGFANVLLSAPNLEKVIVEGGRFEKEDLECVAKLAEGGSILSQLRLFHFRISYILPNRGDFTLICTILKKACAFLPKLTHVKFIFDYEDDYVSLTKLVLQGDATDSNFFSDYSVEVPDWFIDQSLIDCLNEINEHI